MSITTPIFTHHQKEVIVMGTIENVTSSDVKISLFEKKSPGEILTGNQARRQNKYAEEKDMTWNTADIPGRVSQTVKIMPKTDNITLNIAGNGIYDINATQEQVNNYLTEYLRELQKQGVTIKKVISGGQTGVDQAGIIAAQRLGIPSEVHAPSNFSFRGKDGKDVRGNEQLFKERFNQQQQDQNNTANQNTQAIKQETQTQQDMSSEIFYDKQSANEYIQDMIDAGVPKEQIKIEYTKAEGDYDQYWTVKYPKQQKQEQKQDKVGSELTSSELSFIAEEENIQMLHIIYKEWLLLFLKAKELNIG